MITLTDIEVCFKRWVLRSSKHQIPHGACCPLLSVGQRMSTVIGIFLETWFPIFSQTIRHCKHCKLVIVHCTNKCKLNGNLLASPRYVWDKLQKANQHCHPPCQALLPPHDVLATKFSRLINSQHTVPVVQCILYMYVTFSLSNFQTLLFWLLRCETTILWYEDCQKKLTGLRPPQPRTWLPQSLKREEWFRKGQWSPACANMSPSFSPFKSFPLFFSSATLRSDLLRCLCVSDN